MPFTNEELKGKYMCQVVLDTSGWKGFHEKIDPADLLSVSEINNGQSFEDKPHITVCLAMPTPPDDKQQEILRKMAPGGFDLALGRKLKVLPSSRKLSNGDVVDFDVLVIEIETKGPLLDIHKKLCEDGKIVWPYPSYCAHITLAYLKTGAGQKYSSLDVSMKNLCVTELHFRKYKAVDKSGDFILKL